MPSSGPPTFRLRRLHRQRRRRTHRTAILNSKDLTERYCCHLDELEARLIRNHVKYHKDGTGELWVSVPDLPLEVD